MKLSPSRYAFIVLISALTLSYCTVSKNGPGTNIKDVKLPLKLQDSRYEYSSMAWLGSRLLIVPQYPDRFNNELYALKRAEIGQAMRSGNEIAGYETFKLINLGQVIKRIGSTYQGFEAATVINNRIFFALETDSITADCYVVGGTIEQNSIFLDAGKILALPKLKRLRNAGFESLSWLPAQNKLIAFFEYNKADVGSKALLIDTSLAKAPQYIPFDPLLFRITDVAYTGPNKLIGINHHYNGGKKEFAEYIGADSAMAYPPLKGRTLRQSSYTQIIELSVGAGKVSWAPKREVSFTTDNWEGIAPFKNGALIITDEFRGSYLQWVGF